MSNFQKKSIAITGGASGIGLALAKLLASRGAVVNIADVSKATLESAASAIKEQAANGGSVSASQCDVRDPKQVDSWIEEIVQKHGKLDGAANLAGIFGKMSTIHKTHELVQENWDQVIAVNLTGVMNCMRAELKTMKKGASIVNAASTAGLHGAVGAAAYCASKHGVIGLTRVAAKEYGPAGIRVNCVAPGYIWTPMVEDDVAANVGRSNLDQAVEAMPIPRYGKPEEVANFIAWLLSEEASFVTGAVNSVDGGWHT